MSKKYLFCAFCWSFWYFLLIDNAEGSSLMHDLVRSTALHLHDDDQHPPSGFLGLLQFPQAFPTDASTSQNEEIKQPTWYAVWFMIIWYSVWEIFCRVILKLVETQMNISKLATYLWIFVLWTLLSILQVLLVAVKCFMVLEQKFLRLHHFSLSPLYAGWFMIICYR